MGNLHLVTGYAGSEHVTAADQGSFNAELMGNGQFVFARGNQLAATVISNNLIRVLDGDIYMQGRYVRLNEGFYVELPIENGAQGKFRNDLIVARYTMDDATGIESCNLVVIKGELVDSNPVDPEYTTGNILNGGAVLNDMPLYRVPLDGLNVGELVPLFGDVFQDSMMTLPEIRKQVNQIHNEVDAKIAGLDAYTKEETLSDDTKALYGLDKTAVPDDMWAKTLPKVGTIQTTVRTDLGDNWLLCNGESINEADYPELYAKLASWYGKQIEDSVYGISRIVCYNGTFAIACNHEGDGSILVLVSTDGGNSWETNEFASGLTSVRGAMDMACHNGTWVIVGNDGESSAKSYICVATDPLGTWTCQTKRSTSFRGVTCYNGTWAACSGSGYVYYATDPTGTWSEKSTTSSDRYVQRIVCCDGTWFVVGRYDSSSLCYAYANDLNGTWSYTTSSKYNDSWALCCAKGLIVFATKSVDDNHHPYVGVFDVSTSKITYVEIAKVTVSGMNDVIYNNGVWYVTGTCDDEPVVFSTEDLFGVWEMQRFAVPNDQVGASFIAFHENQCVLASGYGVYGSNNKTAVWAHTNTNKILPTITTPDAYVYIKAKDGV